MARNLWIIEKDHINEDKRRVGFGSYQGTGTLEEARKLMPYKFKLYDDDGVLHYEGRMSDGESQAAFDPQDWAESDTGVTETRIAKPGSNKFETL